MSWNLEGQKVVGMYMGDIAVSGTVDVSRVMYGGGISHHVSLDNPVNVYGAVRDRVILEQENIVKVMV